ncbi:MAG: hypothetical protein HFG26_05635 [Provencibacterium sp.]|jgi:hypothetical protein|nr:hypothetical protein [Provencibacterium sp.]
MKPEQLSDALDLLPDVILEETHRVRCSPKRVRKNRLRWAAGAACFAVAVYAGAKMLEQGLPGGRPELPLLTISEETSGGMGFEGYMAYAISELTNGNPWSEASAPTVLPVYQNPAYDSEADFAGMREILEETARRFGLDPELYGITDNAPDEETRRKITEKMDGNVPEGYFDPTKLRLEADGIKLEAEPDGTVTVSFEPALPLPEEYRFTHHASYADAKQVAEYLKEEYADWLGFKYPQVNIAGGDYNIYLQQSYQIEFFDAGGSAAERILHYNLNRAAFYCDDEGELFLVRFYRPDLLRKVGDYPIVAAEEARERLANGNYITSVPYELPGMDYAAKVELIYRAGSRDPYVMPYYRFYVELPELERDGLKTYGAYYVPAVESAYLSDLPTWDGSFN